MGHWVTLDDDQHVYISDGGKVLATRSKISSAGGGKERGKALAARSKAAIGKAMSRSGAVERARSRIENSEIAENFTPELKQAHAGLKALPVGTKVITREGKKGEIVKEWRKPTTLNERSKQENQVRLEGEKTAKFIHPNHVEPIDEKLSWRARSQQSPATTRAIEHAKTAGPGQAREMARSQFKVAERIRTGKMADAALKARYAREDALKAKLNAPKPAAAPVRPKISEPPRSGRDAEGNIHIPDKQLGKAVSTGTSKEGMATFSWDKPSTTRTIEHAKAAEPATIGHKPGEKFSLSQRSATGSKAAENTGRGTTKFMFDMKRGDKPGQTSLLDKVETVETKAKAQPIRHGYAGKYESGPKELPKAGTAAEIAAAAKAHFGRRYAGTVVKDYGNGSRIEVLTKAQDYTGAKFTKRAATYDVTDQPRDTLKRTTEGARIRDYLKRGDEANDRPGTGPFVITERMKASRGRRVAAQSKEVETKPPATNAKTEKAIIHAKTAAKTQKRLF